MADNGGTAGGPPPLFHERMGRLMTAVQLGTPDRVPVSLVMDGFAAQTQGVKMADFVRDVDVAGKAMLDTMELLGDVDSIQFPTMSPGVLGLLWLSHVDLPGVELPDDSLWQLHEQVLIQPEDYDSIVDMGWDAWLGRYIGTHLRDSAAAGQALMEAGPRWAGEYIKRGYVVFSPVTVDHPFEHLCGGRTVKEFMLDLFRIPDKVQAAMDAIMVSKRAQARGMVSAMAPIGVWVGGWRTAPEFLSPKLWDRFVWPYLRELVEIVAEAGGTPILHFDADWDREIGRLLELPKARCVLALDGKSDIFRAKEVLDGHMCLLGDVHPRMLAIGDPQEVYEYSTRLIREVGPGGFILGQGCAIPPNAKLENVRAMIAAAHA